MTMSLRKRQEADIPITLNDKSFLRNARTEKNDKTNKRHTNDK